MSNKSKVKGEKTVYPKSTLRGQLHECVSITYKKDGKNKTTYVDKSRQAEALIMCANYKKMMALINVLTKVNLQLVKSERRTKNGRKK